MLDDQDFPLVSLLKSCTEEQKIERRKELLELLQAAAKLNLQLWAQDTEVQFYSSLDEFDELFNTTDTTMELDNSTNMKEPTSPPVDMLVGQLVCPQAAVLRFQPNGGPPVQLVAMKASIIVFMGDKWKSNKRNFLEASRAASEDKAKADQQVLAQPEAANLDTEVSQNVVAPPMVRGNSPVKDKRSTQTPDMRASTDDTDCSIIEVSVVLQSMATI